MRTPRPLVERMSAKVRFHGETGCWTWAAKLRPDGYLQIRVGGRLVYAHRAVYELLVGPIPDGLTLDHLCRNRACVNPAHLEVVTQAENCRRSTGVSAVAAAVKVCPSGHPYDDSNTYRTPSGGRVCRACARAAKARYKARKRAVA